jgi:hypothetical protein
MKTIIIWMMVVFVTTASLAKDILSLNNQMIFEGKVIKIQDCAIIFKADGKKYVVPTYDISYIEFEDVNNKVYTNYLKYLEMGNDSTNNCLDGKLDAGNYHGKKGTHIALGFLFGPFSIIGTAIASPNPSRDKNTIANSQHQDKFDDPEYLTCYKKKAKGQNILYEGIGWTAWIVVALIFL